jgi:hypothetical protein
MQTSNLFSLFVEVGAWAQTHTEWVLGLCAVLLGYVAVMSLAWSYGKGRRR